MLRLSNEFEFAWKQLKDNCDNINTLIWNTNWRGKSSALQISIFFLGVLNNFLKNMENDEPTNKSNVWNTSNIQPKETMFLNKLDWLMVIIVQLKNIYLHKYKNLIYWKKNKKKITGFEDFKFLDIFKNDLISRMFFQKHRIKNPFFWTSSTFNPTIKESNTCWNKIDYGLSCPANKHSFELVIKKKNKLKKKNWV